MKKALPQRGNSLSRPLTKKFFTPLKQCLLAFVLLAAFIAGCRKVTEDAGLSGICPVVVSTSPADSAVDVSIISGLSATFNEVMDPATINSSSFTLMQGTTLVTGTVSYSGLTAYFTPSAPLSLNTKYTATITTAAKDLAGNALKQNYNWTFTTSASADITAPVIISTDPANGVVGVVLNKRISANFSKLMNPATINNASFLLKQGTNAIAGVVSYSGTTAVFTPSANLTINTVYTATITTAVKDLSGNALVADYTWTFTTGAATDVVAPTVISTDPANGAINVLLTNKPSATFSEAMNPATLNNASFTLSKNGVPVAGTVSYSGLTAVFTPSLNFTANSIYVATITTAAQDLAGNALAANYTWSFTTGALGDMVAPTVISTDPLNNATGVTVSKKPTATFSEQMNPATINSSTFILKQGANSVNGTVSYSGTTAMFSPAANLAPNTLYTATITNSVKDLAGNSMLSNYTWSFTTGTSITPPALGSAAMFGVFGGSAGVTNQGLNTMINNGSIGTTGASTLITGLHDGTTGDIYTETPLNKGTVSGRIYTAPPAPGTATSFAIATQGAIDAQIAYNSISPAARPGGIDPGAGELGGLTLPPGVYKSASGTFKITNGPLTLDAMGDPNAVWIFQTAAGLTVGIAGPSGARSVNLINQAQSKNVFWYVGSAATINGAGGGVMVGTIIASAGVTFSTAGNTVQTVLNGRALSLNASVTLVNTTINVPQ
ncbi:MAG: hypothetical protein JWQ27_743 [Ferruginibacter sp.]|nr:hypothetical protein [Ferruginibacter sp.]